ncbi:toll/interleukin-1 receptor domain-containing protein [Marinactinospora thermotolerans]|uniref:TIR domain-containing protein n=1 Tax=Marinactinospora thermotolerans DSM 45154 TaxID=1122192 RepID=A0A1T4TCA4_9ACTN|nr:toll/interleukin-1 receptor domain-containing protein [Marinactinospora thermotolerans]SKA37961.1 TIR domain-containing protein [Marinactinospora thermotolerans DSM 45154]
MPQIFVNYRTGDEEATATLIERELSRHFGSRSVFRASKSIAPGRDFHRELLNGVHRSDLLLAVIGSGWLEAGDGRGGRALEDPDDWTRREIAEAFAHGIPVVPVLVGAARRIPAGVLPGEIAQIERCQYLRFNHRNAEADIGRLVKAVADAVPGLRHDLDAASPSERVPPQRGPGDRATGGTAVHNHVGGNHGLSQQGRDFHRHSGTGDVGVNHGTVIGTANGPLHTGSGTQINGPQVHGPWYNGPSFHGNEGVNYVAGDQHGDVHQRFDRRRNEDEEGR